MKKDGYSVFKFIIELSFLVLIIIVSISFLIIVFSPSRAESVTITSDGISKVNSKNTYPIYNFTIVGSINHDAFNTQGKLGYFEDTGVMYIISSNGNYTPFLNAEGRPILYEEFIQIK